ncbi:MAG: rRNA pseudouridine synthase [Bacteroidetes bacterium]|nr:rRNA pseudouridine synthase [Bacteroidota bacterium]MBL6944630.1 rRNA pseudouridine synthase [Bacteroidales bacterium]
MKTKKNKNEDKPKNRVRKPQKSSIRNTDGGASKQKTDKDAHDTIKLIRLNKYIADAGICSRREADKLIEKGDIHVNGKVVTQVGTKVNPGDIVKYNGKILRGEKLRYLLLNKPKGFLVTSDDPQDRRTVMNLVEKACDERIYSVGRLDRNTTGLLLFTNDGELTTRLTHPKHGVRKLYHVVLDKPLLKNDLLRIMEGIELEDGIIKPDKINWVTDEMDKRHVGIELHSGRNRIVRRIFEHLHYEVIRLDRVIFAGLTKKDLPRGKWRFLEDKEINILKMI